MGTDTRVQQSTDGGATWSVLSQSPSTTSGAMWIAASADGRMLAVPASDSLMYASTDAGASWNLLATPGRTLDKVVSSADGHRLVGIGSGLSYTTQLVSTPGTAGSVVGHQSDAVTLQYFGGGLFGVVASEGPLGAF
jgi:photosystem II stability/assembly factor-like uncharacterized protein